ncbi:hypothetical protein RDI58_010410 [Solanum bulbocastanum]|uniref:Uncharacterized protein n=1 Tax=Solanum bulbocastanum TaxID=147425 RepID=A0AAN8TQX0_SOLBU
MLNGNFNADRAIGSPWVGLFAGNSNGMDLTSVTPKLIEGIEHVSRHVSGNKGIVEGNWMMVRQLDEVVFWQSQLGENGVIHPWKPLEMCMVEKQGVVCHWNEESHTSLSNWNDITSSYRYVLDPFEVLNIVHRVGIGVDSGLVRVAVGNYAIENLCLNLREWCFDGMSGWGTPVVVVG